MSGGGQTFDLETEKCINVSSSKRSGEIVEWVQREMEHPYGITNVPAPMVSPSIVIQPFIPSLTLVLRASFHLEGKIMLLVSLNRNTHIKVWDYAPQTQ